MVSRLELEQRCLSPFKPDVIYIFIFSKLTGCSSAEHQSIEWTKHTQFALLFYYFVKMLSVLIRMAAITLRRVLVTSRVRWNQQWSLSSIVRKAREFKRAP